MNKQIAGLFDKFYNTILKDQIQDPLIHSEWVYFQSMISNENFERDRITMYLSILQNERKKKNNHLNHKQSLEFGLGDLKLQKRFSEPVKPDLLRNKENQKREPKLKIETKISEIEERDNWRKPQTNKVNFKKLLDAAQGFANIMQSTTIKAI